MNDTIFNETWRTQAEKLILSLRDIVGANISVSLDETEITEISVLAEGHRPPKQIVRDVRSALRAEYQIDLDYRRISVAQKRDSSAEGSRPTPPPAEPTVLTLASARVREEPLTVRLQFCGVTTSIEQHRCRVRVELALGEREGMGEALGANSRREIPRLVALATLDAVRKFLDEGYTLSLSEVEVRRFAGEEVVLVGVKFYKDRLEKPLTGSCVVAHDLQQSVVYATLDALNRILGRLRYREPVEFELRPTSMS